MLTSDLFTAISIVKTNIRKCAKVGDKLNLSF